MDVTGLGLQTDVEVLTEEVEVLTEKVEVLTEEVRGTDGRMRC